MHIVACTGFVGGDTALPHFANADVDYLTRQFVHEITVGIGTTGSLAGVIKVGVSRGGRMTGLDKRIYRAAARAALTTGAPVLTHLAIDAENAITIFEEEGLPLHRVLFGHVDDGVNAEKTRDVWIAEKGGRIGFDTFGYETELPDPPFWARPRKERLDHFLRFIDGGRRLGQVLASADANCSPARLARRQGPHRQLHLRGPHPGPPRRRSRRDRHQDDLRRQPRHLPDPPEVERPTMQLSDLQNLKIAVIGAGYGGAAAAKALSLLGARVDVYEQASRIREVGAGIGLRPATMNRFREWGVFDAIAEVTSPATTSRSSPPPATPS